MSVHDTSEKLHAGLAVTFRHLFVLSDKIVSDKIVSDIFR
jgi:hypothetical protein